MKLGFNEANDRFCKNHSVMMDLELCGFIETFSGRSFSLDALRIPQEFSGCNGLGALSFVRALSRDYAY